MACLLWCKCRRNRKMYININMHLKPHMDQNTTWTIRRTGESKEVGRGEGER